MSLSALLKTFAPYSLLRRINARLARIGPYRFINRRYFGTDDIAMAMHLIDVEPFRHDIIPQPLPIESLRSILLLAPHPDDEVIGAGGALALAKKAGVHITILYFTDGQQVDHRRETRQQEGRMVCQHLGAEMLELNISNMVPEPGLQQLEKLNEIIHSIKPDVILCPWLLDGAPKHRMVNHLLWLADQLKSLPDTEIWGYQVQNTLLPNGYINITDVAEEKRTLLRYFPSQNGKRHWDHVSMGLSAWNSRLLPKSDRPLFVEIFFTLPVRDLLGLVKAFYFKDIALTYVGEQSLGKHMRDLHQSIVKDHVYKNGR